MNIEINVEGQVLVKMEIDLSLLPGLLDRADSGAQLSPSRSTPASRDQMEELLRRVDPRSAQLLRSIAASKGGSISWVRMRQIFGIRSKSNWAAYSGSHGKGITRALRNILNNRSARLIWWNDNDWDSNDWDSAKCAVYIDGPALVSLRAALGL
jgi:hypothetical protein